MPTSSCALFPLFLDVCQHDWRNFVLMKLSLADMAVIMAVSGSKMAEAFALY
ncbi:hypothetical protein AB3464_25900 [Pseudomonas asplenii]|uniref:hypothetical protein n=1 Tax=Pseudomonas asplenii TaxID=53407 RepID=UPI0037CC71BF